MITVIHESTPIARKAYWCDACEFIQEAIGDTTFTISDLRLIVKARRNGWKIQPGQRYIRQFNSDYGETWTFRAIPEMDAICRKYDLYPEYR